MSKKSKQIINTCFQTKTETTSVALFAIMKNPETTEKIPASEITESSPAPWSALMAGFSTPLQVPTEIFRGNPDSRNGPNLSEICASEDNLFDASYREFLIQKTVFLPFCTL